MTESQLRELATAAWNRGHSEGRRNFHHTRANFQTSIEWLQWLDGWRFGQLEWKAAHPEAFECLMARRFGAKAA